MTRESIDPTRPRPQTARSAKISAGCRRAERSHIARDRYIAALRVLAAIRLEALAQSPDQIERALEIIERHLLPGSPAHAAVLFVTTCRAPRSFSRWVRRHPAVVAEILRGARR